DPQQGDRENVHEPMRMVGLARIGQRMKRARNPQRAWSIHAQLLIQRVLAISRAPARITQQAVHYRRHRKSASSQARMLCYAFSSICNPPAPLQATSSNYLATFDIIR